MKYRELLLNIAKEFSKLSSIFTKVEEIQTILNRDNISQFFQVILTIFTSNISAFYRIFEKLRDFTKIYKSLRKFMKVMIFHNIFLVKSLAFVPFRLLAMYFLHFVISYNDERNFPVCYRTVSPLDNIGKYFAIVKR